MIALNSAIDALDAKISGKLQLDLYAAVEDLLLDRIVWFVRNVDVSKGLSDVVEHYRAGIEAITGALYRVLPPDAERALTARTTELINAGVPEDLARAIANLRALGAAPDIISVADRTGKPVQDVAATYYAAGAFFQLDRIANAARGIQVTDYFDRLALDRALDSIGESERRLTAQMVGNGVTGPEAVDAWITPRSADVERIRAAVHGIASSGLTISKLSVAASLLGDLVKD
jgi:glutamate dehydrogenase